LIIQSELLSLSVSDWKQFSLIIKIGKRLTLKNYKYQTVLFRSSIMCKLCRCTHKLYIKAIRHLFSLWVHRHRFRRLHTPEKKQLILYWMSWVSWHPSSFDLVSDYLFGIFLKCWWPILEQSFKFAGVLWVWLLEWSSYEKLCLVGKINQYASEWQQTLFECVVF
jgi:hypothetical protein